MQQYNQLHPLKSESEQTIDESMCKIQTIKIMVQFAIIFCEFHIFFSQLNSKMIVNQKKNKTKNKIKTSTIKMNCILFFFFLVYIRCFGVLIGVLQWYKSDSILLYFINRPDCLVEQDKVEQRLTSNECVESKKTKIENS